MATSNAFSMTGGGGFDMSGLLELLTQGTQSPLLKAILGPLLKIQERSFKPQQQNLTDMFRSAGALRDTSYGKGMGTLLGDQALAKQGLIGSTAQSFLGPLLQALMESQRMNMSAQARSSSDPWAGIPPSQGLATPMSGGGSSTSLANSYGGSGFNPPGGGLNLDALMKMLSGSSGGSVAGLGSQAGWSDPSQFIKYTQPTPSADPWAGVMNDQDWSNFLGE